MVKGTGVALNAGNLSSNKENGLTAVGATK